MTESNNKGKSIKERILSAKRSQKIRFAIVSVLFFAFLTWLGNWWFLLVYPVCNAVLWQKTGIMPIPKNNLTMFSPCRTIYAVAGSPRHSADGKQRNGSVEANTALQRFIPIQKSKLTRRANTVIVECTKK